MLKAKHLIKQHKTLLDSNRAIALVDEDGIRNVLYKCLDSVKDEYAIETVEGYTASVYPQPKYKIEGYMFRSQVHAYLAGYDVNLEKK